MPYSFYETLISKKEASVSEDKIELEQFVGLLSDEFKTDDARYNEIIK